MSSRAIILAAGRGSRMGEETAIKPKCLTILDGKPLLDWQLSSLRKAEIDNISLVRGYRSDMLVGNFDTVDNLRWSETNMVASLFCAPPFEGDTIISYSDIVYNANHIKKLMLSPYDITITADRKWEELWALRFENPLDDAETFIHEGATLLEIGSKTKDISNIQAQYMGLLKLTEKGWEQMYNLYQTFSGERKNKMDMTGMLNVLLKNGVKVNVVFIEGKWCEVDAYSDVLIYEQELKKNNNWQHDWR